MGTRWGQSYPWGTLILLQLWGMALSAENQHSLKHRNCSQTLTTAPLLHPHPKIPSPIAPITSWTAPDLCASQQNRFAACLKSSSLPTAPQAGRAGLASPGVTQSRGSWHSPAGTCCPVTVTRHGRSACHGSVLWHFWH